MDNTVTSIVFFKKTNKFELKFTSGLHLIFPFSHITPLKGQNHSVIERVSVIKKGSAIKWEELELEIPIKSLCKTLLEGESWSLSNSS